MPEIFYNWYAVNTRPKWEKKVARVLDEKGIQNYCPLNKVVRQWSDRKKVILEPIFKSYVFVKVEEQKKWDIKNIDGILNYVYWLGKPAKIKEEEINIIKKFLNEFNDVQIEQIGLKINQRVRIKQGVLMNYEGILVEISGNRAFVKIESMGLQLSAHFDKKNLENVN
ncbi:MAG TPA: UpxY family transcription antiterminator [Chitinophagaceae bacterium]|nr:UpxY family transcription antiterminator [Chitinophagaceae bacterium]